MFENIVTAMRKSLNHTTLDVLRLGSNKQLRDVIRCTSLGKLTADQLEDDCMYRSQKIKDGVTLLYIFIDGKSIKDLNYDVVDRDGNTTIVIYRYSDFPTEDEFIIERLLREADTIMQTLYGFLYSATGKSGNMKATFEMFKYYSSRQKMLVLAPYMIVCKIFEGVNIGLHTGGNFTLQKALNSEGIEEIDKVVNFILKENPTTDALFSLNGFLLPFGADAE